MPLMRGESVGVPDAENPNDPPTEESASPLLNTTTAVPLDEVNVIVHVFASCASWVATVSPPEGPDWRTWIKKVVVEPVESSFKR